MAMSHDACTHPRTPAGRSACRKAGGPDATKVAKHVNFAIKLTDATKPHTRRKAAIKAASAELANVRTARNPDGVGRASLADLPRVFRTVVEFATHEGYPHNVYTKGRQTMVDLVAPHGTLTLTWASSTPDGVNAVSWRPAGTSVASRMSTVNDGLVKLKG